MIELHQLRCFIAVAEELHFGRAANRLDMTQPPLSRQIQALEAAIGVRLLHRNRRMVALTPAGRLFLSDARMLLDTLRGAMNRARMAQRGEAGALTLGFTALAAVSLIPNLVAAAQRSHPDIAVILREMLSTDQERQLLAGQLDLAILRPPVRSPELVSVRIQRERLVLALPMATADDWDAEAGLHALHGRPFIMYSPDEAQFFFDLLTGLFQQAGTAPEFVQHAGTPYAILALVGIGLGAALVPESARLLPAEGVRFRSIALPGHASVDFLLAWRRSNDNPALPTMIATVETLAGLDAAPRA